MLTNSELTINQGSNLKLKLGDQRYDDRFPGLEFLWNRTVGKPPGLFHSHLARLRMNSPV
jgi:hypothetical protein